MKISRNRLKQIIKEELSEALDLKTFKFYDEEKDWGRAGNRFDAARLRSDFPLGSAENLTDDHIEVAIRDAIYDDEYLNNFAKNETMVSGMSNAKAIKLSLEGDVEDLWQTWSEDNSL